MDQPVIRVESFRSAAAHGPAPGNDYHGLGIHALPGLHDFVARVAADHLPKSAAILDLGAGSGALCARWRDAGYTVSALDIVREGFRLPSEIPFFEADLNGAFADGVGSRFDALSAIEVIEHVENPRHFLRQCARLLKPGGQLILSTPNIDNPLSKALFVRDGLFQWFGDTDYTTHGHLMPIPQRLLARCARECGFEMRWRGTYGNPLAGTGGWAKMRLFARVLGCFDRSPRSMRGEILVVVLRLPPSL